LAGSGAGSGLITTLLLTRPVLAYGVLDGDKKTMARGIAPLVDAVTPPPLVTRGREFPEFPAIIAISII
jgi:hypothetical protein